MPIARRSGVDPVLMGIAINGGISAGGLAPTSLFYCLIGLYTPSILEYPLSGAWLTADGRTVTTLLTCDEHL